MPSNGLITNNNRVVILGAGVCGLYAGLELSSAGVPVTVIERETSPGGLAAGLKRGQNYYDLGVHMLHGFDREILERIRQLMGSESIPVELNAKIRWVGREFRYPLQFRDMVSGVPPLVLARCIVGLLSSEAKNRMSKVEPANAEEALIQLYGRPLYEFFFEQFTTRYWGTPTVQLSAAFIKAKMPRLAVRDLVLSVLQKTGFSKKPDFGVASALADETLYYSPSGAEAMPRILAETIRRAGGEVLLGRSVSALNMLGTNGPYRVEFNDQTGRRHQREFSHCISSIPLPRLIEALNPTAPQMVRDAASRLKYRSIVIYGLLVRKRTALDALYIYYRNRMFHRIGEPKNAGLQTCPPDHTVLIVEMTCDIGDGRWRGDVATKKQLFDELEQEGVCSADQIVEQHILRCPEAYPIFALGFEQHLDTVVDYLKPVTTLCSTGRQGAFCYPNMHGAMRMGAEAAHAILDQLSPVEQKGSGAPDHTKISVVSQDQVFQAHRG
jgi:protoporphyrinogen oxidase